MWSAPSTSSAEPGRAERRGHARSRRQGTVPQALVAFLESTSYEDALRNAISLGGDADTLACITGGIAEAHYRGVPRDIAAPVLAILDPRLVVVVNRFRERFGLA